jgi:hypothetical protein
MPEPCPTIAYVADESRLHHLLAGIAGWRRFGTYPVAVIDIGLGAEGREHVRRVAGGEVAFLSPVTTTPLPAGPACLRRAFAFEQKTLLGGVVPGDPVVFLDADVLVVAADFIPRLARVGDDTLLAARSAWDADFTWTYTPASLPHLRRATGRPDLATDHPVCNSGVWAMRAGAAARVSGVWHRMFRAATDSPALRATLRPGTEIGDQEFLLPACAACGLAWEPLHGSFNMQVHERRMPWAAGPGGHPVGGHPGEPAEPVRAVHYGCDPDGTPQLTADMIASAEVRAWLAAEYAACWGRVRDAVGSGGSAC